MLSLTDAISVLDTLSLLINSALIVLLIANIHWQHFAIS